MKIRTLAKVLSIMLVSIPLYANSITLRIMNNSSSFATYEGSSVEVTGPKDLVKVPGGDYYTEKFRLDNKAAIVKVNSYGIEPGGSGIIKIKSDLGHLSSTRTQYMRVNIRYHFISSSDATERFDRTCEVIVGLYYDKGVYADGTNSVKFGVLNTTEKNQCPVLLDGQSEPPTVTFE